MRIVVWNCAMKLTGKKLAALENLQPDIAIVPECARPEKLWGKQPLLAPIPMEWIGDDDNKGLGVLAFNGYRLVRHRNYDSALRWMLPLEIKGPVEFNLLAIWTPQQRPPKTADGELPEQTLPAVERYRRFLSASPSVVAGDFDMNVGSGRGAKAANQAPLIAGLERLGLASAYHVGRGELHGKESSATRYGKKLKADVSKQHVDYCFLPLEWCSHIRQIEIGEFDGWVQSGLSDHVPLIVDLDLTEKHSAARSKPEKVKRPDMENTGYRIKWHRKR